jgi:hypothetical protein
MGAFGIVTHVTLVARCLDGLGDSGPRSLIVELRKIDET